MIKEKIEKKRKLKKKGFPAGIFLILFITESIAASGGILFYFYITAKKRIDEVETYTKNYSMTLADAFANVAELSYKSRDYRDLKQLFHEKIRENTIDEAFFALSNGTLVAHSIKEIEETLQGNIANDEFAYNLDLILKPVKEKSKEIQFVDYNIIGNQVPFTRSERTLIKKYLYKNINRLGWLISRAVFVRGKPVGTVNFIISRDRIYSIIKYYVTEARDKLPYAAGGAFFLSFIVSFIVFVRYRSIQRRAVIFMREELSPDEVSLNEPVIEKQEVAQDYITVDLMAAEDSEETASDIAMMDLIRDGVVSAEKELSGVLASPVNSDDIIFSIDKKIRDAIPVEKKEQ